MNSRMDSSICLYLDTAHHCTVCNIHNSTQQVVFQNHSFQNHSALFYVYNSCSIYSGPSVNKYQLHLHHTIVDAKSHTAREPEAAAVTRMLIHILEHVVEQNATIYMVSRKNQQYNTKAIHFYVLDW